MGVDLTLVGALLSIGIAVYLFVSSFLSVDESAQALSWATGNEPVKSKSKFIEASRPFVHKFCLTFARTVKSPSYRRRVQHKILTASLNKELNVDEFIGLQFLWGIVFPIVLMFLNFTLELKFPYVFLACTGFAGAYFPHIHTNIQREQRVLRVLADLPFFIDLMALSTRAGLDLIGAIQRIVEKADDSVLAQELKQVLADLQLGSSRADAMKKLSERLDIPEITSFVIVVVDADATGAKISDVLQSHAAQMRLERFTRAEKAGAKASQLILLPVLFLIVPAVFIMVFGPVILNFSSGGN